MRGLGKSAEAGGHGGSLYYGWVIVGAAVVMLAGLSGSQLSFGVFLRPVSDSFGWSNAEISGAMSLSTGVGGLIGLFVGRFTDKYDVRSVIAVGMATGIAGYALLAIVDSLWLFYLCFGLGTGICAGCSYTPANATVSKWFSEDKRALALGIALTGMVVGQTVLAPGMSRLISVADWRFAYLMMAAVVFVCGLPALFLMGRKPTAVIARRAGAKTLARVDGSSLTQGYSAREAARTPPFWMLAITGVTMSVAFYILIAHTVDCAEGLGISKDTASLILTASGLGSLTGTLTAGWLMKKMGGRNTLLWALLIQSASTFMFMLTTDAWSFFLVSAVCGFSYGAAIPVRMAMVPPLFGLKAVGAILGWSAFAWAVGGVVGPYLTGYIYDATQSYDIAFLMGGMLLLVGAGSVFLWGAHRQVPAQTG